eukprot:6099788-Pyramimonas_sp.AAC.1
MARGLTVVGRTLGGSMCASLRQELPQGANFAQRLMPLALGTSSARSFMNQHFDLPLSRGFAGNLDSFGSRCYSTKVEDDTHDDFKPVSHAEGSSDVKSYIEQCLNDHKVTIVVFLMWFLKTTFRTLKRPARNRGLCNSGNIETNKKPSGP